MHRPDMAAGRGTVARRGLADAAGCWAREDARAIPDGHRPETAGTPALQTPPCGDLRRPRFGGVDAYIGSMSLKSSPTIARLRRPPPVLLCGKCLSRSKDGKKLKLALKAELKQQAAARGGRRARLVTTGCLGICPKRAVVTASAATLGRGEYVLVAERGAAGEAVAVLTGEQG
jgi:hypothetical protein